MLVCPGNCGGIGLEKDAGYLLGYKIRFLATHLLRHRRIVLDIGVHAHYESLIPNPAHHLLRKRFSLALGAAHHRFVTDSAKRGAI